MRLEYITLRCNHAIHQFIKWQRQTLPVGEMNDDEPDTWTWSQLVK